MLNPHLGEFESLSLGEPPVWQTIINGSDIETQTGDGTVAIRIASDGSVTFPQGLDSGGGGGGSINADTLDGLDSTDFVQTTDSIDADRLDGLDSSDFVLTADTIDAETLDGLDSTDFVQTTDAINADTLDDKDSADFGVLAEDETVTGNWTFLNGLSVPTVTTDPASPVAGDVWYNSTDDAARIRLANSTITFASGETSPPPTGATMLEDFEGAWPGDWTGTTGDYSITTSPTLEGTQSLRSVNSFKSVANSQISTTRDGTYSCLVQPAASSAPALLTNVQSTAQASIFDDCYYAQLNETENRLYIICRSGSSATFTEYETGVTINANTTYRLKVILGADTVKAQVEESDGTLKAETVERTDTTHTGGSVGLYRGGSGVATYDAIRKE